MGRTERSARGSRRKRTPHSIDCAPADVPTRPTTTSFAQASRRRSVRPPRQADCPRSASSTSWNRSGSCRPTEIARYCDSRTAPSAFRKPAPCGERVVPAVTFRRVLQNRFHRIRRQRGIGLQHQRDGSGHDRRRHAGPAQAQIRKVRRRQSVPASRYRRAGSNTTAAPDRSAIRCRRQGRRDPASHRSR